MVAADKETRAGSMTAIQINYVLYTASDNFRTIIVWLHIYFVIGVNVNYSRQLYYRGNPLGGFRRVFNCEHFQFAHFEQYNIIQLRDALKAQSKENHIIIFIIILSACAEVRPAMLKNQII